MSQATIDFSTSSMHSEFTLICAAEANKASAMRMPSSSWRSLRMKALSFESRENNWDGFGASPPGFRLIDSSLDFLTRLESRGVDPPSCVLLSPSGSILFTWDDPDGHTDAELFEPCAAEWMRMRSGQPTEFKSETWMSRRQAATSTSVVKMFYVHSDDQGGAISALNPILTGP